MKTLKEYLTESKKVYSFKIKVAGDLPESFQDNLKTALDRCKCIKLEKMSTTPIQALPLDFPTMKNTEVHVFEAICEYPITAPEIVNELRNLGLTEECFRVRGSGEPSEVEQILSQEEPSGKAVLEEPTMDVGKIKAKDYFGDEFNKTFLKDLEKTSKQKKKESSGPSEYKLPKAKVDKTGIKSPLGTKELR